ncbi:MAG: ribose 5-phosphate isomerase B [Deltaproteobacteria bacterium]|nr:MAG: ribose 5-phosphate isomerase B [Deltaproteobacteria bacterium]
MGDAVVIASDHRGTKLKAALRERLEAEGHPVTDVGAFGDDSVDYPDFAAAAARAVSRGDVPRGIVICGSGLGVSYTANRFPGVRAAWVQDLEAARMSREHNDANVLALPADRLDVERAWPLVATWLGTPFEGGRHARRVAKIDQLSS